MRCWCRLGVTDCNAKMKGKNEQAVAKHQAKMQQQCKAWNTPTGATYQVSEGTGTTAQLVDQVWGESLGGTEFWQYKLPAALLKYADCFETKHSTRLGEFVKLLPRKVGWGLQVVPQVHGQLRCIHQACLMAQVRWFTHKAPHQCYHPPHAGGLQPPITKHE
jgi:hypothetical protein